MDRAKRPGRERGPAVGARNAQTMHDVALGLEPVERREVVADRDALPELAQLLAIELLAKLGLADEDDLQQLALVGLEVGQEPDLLEQLGLEVLGLIDQENHVV